MKPKFGPSSGMSLLAFILATALSCPASANPTGGTVSAGNASISSSGNTLTVNQSTNSAVIDWRGFDINQGETTNFVQPSSSSITLNRVNSPSASTINGALNANGNIVIVNQNGVLFGKNAKVNVNSLVVSTADIDNAPFMAGNYAFNKAGNPNATIQNEGMITAKQAGLVGFVAPNVLNSGIITAKLGTIQLASGDTFTVDLYGDGLFSVQASPALQSQLVQNTGKLKAAGGTIALTAAAAAQTVNSLIQVGGELDAPAIAQKNGSIYIYAEGSNAVQNNVTANKGTKSGTSAVNVTGKLNVSSKTGTGGTVNVLGDNVTLAGTARIKANGATGGGTVDIGGQSHGAGNTPTALNTTIEGGAMISANAAQNGNGGNVTVWSDGTTNFSGSILAQGGAQGGNGGNVETSGTSVDFKNAVVNTTAPKGTMGNWLVDPAGLTIDAALASSIDASLASTSVTLTTTSSTESSSAGYTLTGAEQTTTGTSGTIAVNNPINAGAGTGSLTLSAYSDIAINADITLNGGTLTLQSNNAGAANGSSGAGAISIIANIATNGGNIIIGGGSGTISAGSGYALGDSYSGEGIVFNSTISAGGGNIILNGRGFELSSCFGSCTGVLASGGSITTTGNGSISINGIGGGGASATFNSGVQVNGGMVSAVNGNINLTGQVLQTDPSGASFAFGNGATVETTGSGNINFTEVGTLGGGFTGYGSVNPVISGGNLSYKGFAFNMFESLWTWTAAGSITIAPYSSNTSMGIGSGSGSFNVSDTILGNMTAPSYVFGSSNVSTLSVDTGTNFGTSNVTFVSGGTIGLSNTLTSAGGNLTFSEPVVLNAATTVSAGSGTETFSGTVNGDYNLTASAASFSFGGAVGNTTPLAAISLTSANTLALPTIKGASILAQTTGAAADISIASGSVLTASGTGNAVTLAAARNFINSEGSGAIILTGAGAPNWLVYSTTPGADSFGSLNSGNTAVWDATYGGTISQTGDRYVFAYQPTVTLTTISDSKTYGANYASSVANDYEVTGLQTGVTNAFNADSNATAFSGTPTVTSAGSAASVSVAGGPYAISIAQTLTGIDGYAVAYSSPGLLTVNKANLTVTTYGPSIKVGQPLPSFTGSNNLVAQDTSLVSWSYAPIGYSGSAGSYLIGASASDPQARLANYNITMNDGTFVVLVNSPVIDPTINQIPSTVRVTSQNPFINLADSTATGVIGSSSGGNNGTNNPSGGFFTTGANGAVAKTFGNLDIAMTPALEQQLGYSPQGN